MTLSAHLTQFLASIHPYDSLTEADLVSLAALCNEQTFSAGEQLFDIGDEVDYLYIIIAGQVDVFDEAGNLISILGPRNSFGERALLRGEKASRRAMTTDESKMILMPASVMFEQIEASPVVARFFQRGRSAQANQQDMAALPVENLMTADPLVCAPETPIKDAASLMAARRISSICIVGPEGLCGIMTLRDINEQVVAGEVNRMAPVSSIMSLNPLTLTADALGTDVLHLMTERRIRQIPIVKNAGLVGIVTQTDLVRAQALTSVDLISRIAQSDTAAQMAQITAGIPQLLAQLVASGKRQEAITRIITDIADTVTRRLLALAEAALGAPPVPYLWLACGSQGRQEQTGVSDQDNCLILSDALTEADMPYFASLAKFVSDGLDTCGYFYCPGDMMATNPRWCQPVRVWRDYFAGWIAKPDGEAQMLASVMFDLRPIGGDESLFAGLQEDTLAAAGKNSIFVAHMIANSLKHHPPLGLLRGLATIRSGEHRDTLDLKHNGVVPVVDLGRVYALQGGLTVANTRARLDAAQAAGVLSERGGADLLDAYDLIATTRLEHQCGQIKVGAAPDNFLAPVELSDFERSHLRDAFVVIKTMQAAVGSGKGMIG